MGFSGKIVVACIPWQMDTGLYIDLLWMLLWFSQRFLSVQICIIDHTAEFGFVTGADLLSSIHAVHAGNDIG